MRGDNKTTKSLKKIYNTGGNKMNNTNVRKTICAALAGLMLTMTGCGGMQVSTDMHIQDASEPDTIIEPDYTAPADNTVSVAPLSDKKFEANGVKPDEEFYAAYRNYAAEFFKASCTEDIKAGNNAMVSPESVMMALGMTANGAKGDTLAQMEAVLGGHNIDTLNNAMQYSMGKFMNSEYVDFNVANSVWVRDDSDRISISQEFCNKVKNSYNADTFLAPFDGTTLGDINNWVYNNTNGMVPNILDEIPPEAVAYLVNAIAFESEWETQYTDDQITENGIFTNAKGEEENVNMMYSDEGGYFEDENTTGFVKNYKGGEYAFMALLPKEGTDMADYVASIDGEKLNKLWSERGGDASVCIPEFTYDYGNELSDELIAMGMELPFSDAADFSGMGETGSGALYINRVIHKTHIEVDRKGTKAAAATAVEMTDECAVYTDEPMNTVYLNRPFVYAIVDTENGTPIFMGAVNTVNS